MTITRQILSIFSTLLLSSCLLGSSKTKSYSAFEVRAGVAYQAFSQMAPQDQALLRQGRFRVGLPEIAMYIARGQPILHWRTKLADRDCRVLVYENGESNNIAIYSCNNTIVHWANVKPSLPCWRFAQVAPRLIEQVEYFEQQSLVRQWELVAGVLRRGQSSKDVYIAYGKPYNRGMEEREDGVRSDTQVFLDHGGEAYGLQITLIDNLVAGWRIPAQRQMTPEAQKKRLELTEQRLMAKLRELDDNAERRHQETVTLLNDVLANQDEMKNSLANIDENVGSVLGLGGAVVGDMIGGEELGDLAGSAGNLTGAMVDGGRKSDGEFKCRSGSKTLSINSCVYNEIPGKCSLGRPCSEGNGCSSEYTCEIVGGSSGMCVPSDYKYSKCDKPRYSVGPKCQRRRDCKGSWKGSKCKMQKHKKYGYCLLPLD